MESHVFSCYASTSAYGNFNLIKTMRASPSITFNSLGEGNIQAYNSGAERTLTSISLAVASIDRVAITLVGSGWSAGQAMHVNNFSSSVPFFTASAEL